MFEKLAHFDASKPEDQAYVYGFRTKLAEHGITLEEFLEYAEKTAFFGGLGKSFQAMKKLPGAVGDWRKSRRLAGQIDEAGGRGYSTMANDAREWANKDLMRAGKAALPAAGVTAAGLGGVNYAASPANTTSNQMKQMSNQHLGTNFGMQSRIGSMFG